jgi:hypothetical protein
MEEQLSKATVENGLLMGICNRKSPGLEKTYTRYATNYSCHPRLLPRPSKLRQRPCSFRTYAPRSSRHTCKMALCTPHGETTSQGIHRQKSAAKRCFVLNFLPCFMQAPIPATELDESEPTVDQIRVYNTGEPHRFLRHPHRCHDG